MITGRLNLIFPLITVLLLVSMLDLSPRLSPTLRFRLSDVDVWTSIENASLLAYTTMDPVDVHLLDLKTNSDIASSSLFSSVSLSQLRRGLAIGHGFINESLYVSVVTRDGTLLLFDDNLTLKWETHLSRFLPSHIIIDDASVSVESLEMRVGDPGVVYAAISIIPTGENNDTVGGVAWFACDLHTGAIRWEHVPEPNETYLLPFAVSDRHAGELPFESFRQSLLAELPSVWARPADSYLALRAFRREKTAGPNLPNAVVARFRIGIEVVHAYTGQPVTHLHLAPEALHYCHDKDFAHAFAGPSSSALRFEHCRIHAVLGQPPTAAAFAKEVDCTTDPEIYPTGADIYTTEPAFCDDGIAFAFSTGTIVVVDFDGDLVYRHQTRAIWSADGQGIVTAKGDRVVVAGQDRVAVVTPKGVSTLVHVSDTNAVEFLSDNLLLFQGDDLTVFELKQHPSLDVSLKTVVFICLIVFVAVEIVRRFGA